MSTRNLPMDLATVQDAAERFNVSAKTIRNWISNGFVTGYRMPGARLIRVDIAEIESKFTVIPAVTR